MSILLALFYSTNFARDHGAGIINTTIDIGIRISIELTFMELGVKHGPQFIRDSLHKVAGANSYVTPCRTLSEPTKRLSLYSTLLHAWYRKEFRELSDDSLRKPYYCQTITCHLREACADKIGCDQDEVMSRILDMVKLPEHRLAWLSRPDRASLVLGLPLDGKARVEESD